MPNNCAEQWEDYSDGVPVEGDPSTRVGLKIVDGEYVIGCPPETKGEVDDLTDVTEAGCARVMEY